MFTENQENAASFKFFLMGNPGRISKGEKSFLGEI